MLTQTEARERLESLKARKTAAREAKKKAADAIAAARQVNDADALAIATSQYEQAHTDVEFVNGLEMALLRQTSGLGGRDFGAALRDNPQAHDALREIAGSSAQMQNFVHVGPLLSMEQTCELFGRYLAAPVSLPDSPTPGRDGGFLGIAPTPVAPTSLLDVFRAVPFEGRKAEFLRRTGGVAAAAVQVEGQPKQEASLVYDDAEAEALTVASYSKVKRQAVDDIDGLLADMGLALRQGVLVKVEDILVGSHAASGGPFGVWNSPGVLTPTVTSGDPLPKVVGTLKTALAIAGVNANFASAHPLDIEEEEERTGDDGHYINSIDEQGRIRRLPLIPSIALDVGEVLVGDSRIAARLGVRSPVSLAVGQEQDDMTRNMVTGLVECRVAPIVDVPGALAKGVMS